MRVAHDTATSIHSIQKSTRNSQKIGTKLGSGWIEIKRNRVGKLKSPKKKKREDVQNKKLIAATCEAI